jgi:hypothetical protein
MIMRKILASITACILLAGCAGFPLTGDPSKDLPAAGAALTSADSTAQQSVAAIAKFTAADIQAALADAQANNDAPAISCYSAILPVVQAQSNPQAAVVGAVSTFQRSRDIVKLVKGQGAIAQACAALKQDVTGDVLGLGTLFGLP